MALIEEEIENKEPTDEERFLERKEWMMKLADLPLDFGMIVLVRTPDSDVNIHVSGLAVHEILGMLEVCKLRAATMALQGHFVPVNDDEPQQVM